MPAGNGQAECDALRDTLLAYIAADALAQNGTAVTGADGRAVFTGLSAGMYLVDEADMEVGGSTRQYAPSLIAVPGVGEGGNWRYDVTAAPKYTEKPGGDEPDTPITYTVVKLWAGNRHLQRRRGAGKADAVCRQRLDVPLDGCRRHMDRFGAKCPGGLRRHGAAQRQQLLCDQYAQCCTRPDTHAGAYPKTYAGAGRQTSDGRRVPPDAVYRLHGGIRAGASTAGSVEQKSEA